ncbi:hypothetical protein R3P38DRAFT_3304311 [Favolaschia claudopus]|uniref:Uncharacterized protein n=1 Tax=Favolaschia claudopus TaxID=2862362 RepID=A0AAW0E1M0_9AGAR
MTVRKIYSGPRALVLGIDVGTTYSGLSYSILEPGGVPVIRPITRFPGQQDVGGDSKVPTAILYDKYGIVRSEGADTILPTSLEKADDEGWERAQWSVTYTYTTASKPSQVNFFRFKLHLRPAANGPDLPPLPHRKTATSVFADFLQYLFECAKTFIIDSNGADLWASLQHNIRFVLTHPNGWEGKQQSQMRDAAIVAGLIPNSEAGHDRLRFVTEGEASLHFCIQNGLDNSTIDSGGGVVIVDAGGGTIDISSYRVVKKYNGHKEYEEIAPPQCLFQGSIYVTQRAHEYLEVVLRDSKYADDIDSMAQIFDTSAKLTFRGGSDEFAFIKFGAARDQDPAHNIRNGQLKIPGSDVQEFFEPSITAVANAVKEQCVSALGKSTISSVFVVGGFAANDYFFSELKARLQPHIGLNVTRPDAHLNKAVADGAVSFHIDHHVSVRVARFTYGVKCSEAYNPSNNEHFTRASTRYVGVSGETLVPGRFSAILKKGTQVAETKEFSETYIRRSDDPAALDRFSTELYLYRGRGESPQWFDVEPELYEVACRIEADTSRAIAKYPLLLRLRPGVTVPPAAVNVYEVNFRVVLSLGLTELKAQIAWTENGKEIK